MNILKFSKYPPIEGGESSKAYWRSKAIAEKGCKVFLVTNAFEVEEQYRIKLEGKDLDYYRPKNLQVYNTSPFEMPSFIPKFNPMTLKLISKGIEVLESEEIDVIEGSYLLPYGFAASYLAKEFKKPLVITHAGSDMTRLVQSQHYSGALIRVLKNADKIITFKGGNRLFSGFGIEKNKIAEIKTAVNTGAFNPKVKKASLKDYFGKEPNGTILTHFGKIHRSKGIYQLIEAASKLNKNFSICFFGKGSHENHFKEFVKKKKMSKKVFFHDFIPPWRVPEVIKASDCLLSVEHEFGVAIHGPIMPREAMAVGKATLLSNEINLYNLLEDCNQAFKINPANLKEYAEKLKLIIESPELTNKVGLQGLKWFEKQNNFEEFISKTIGVFESLLRK